MKGKAKFLTALCLCLTAVFILSSEVTSGGKNIAVGKKATSSSNESDALVPKLAVDGSKGTRWSSKFADNQWLKVDLGSVQTITKIRIIWEAALGRKFDIQISDDGKKWKTVYSRSKNTKRYSTAKLPEGTKARYVRMMGYKRGTPWGFSIFEMEVYN